MYIETSTSHKVYQGDIISICRLEEVPVSKRQVIIDIIQYISMVACGGRPTIWSKDTNGAITSVVWIVDKNSAGVLAQHVMDILDNNRIRYTLGSPPIKDPRYFK